MSAQKRKDRKANGFLSKQELIKEAIFAQLLVVVVVEVVVVVVVVVVR